MEKKITQFSTLMLIAIMVIIYGCSKTASAPKPEPEIKGPTETVVLNMVSASNEAKVGSLYIDNMNGKARARIHMDSGYYKPGSDMKANITLTTSDGTVIFANCKDVSGSNGQCSTFPITVLKDNSDALFSKIVSTDGIVFNVLDKDNKVYARSTSQTIVINN
jgi:hypothetical protein